MINNTTAHLHLPLPHEHNLLEEDVPRLIASFVELDRNAATTYQSISNLTANTAANVQELTTRTNALKTEKLDNTDPRLSDSRTPTAHAATHKTGGSDALVAADIGGVSPDQLPKIDNVSLMLEAGVWKVSAAWLGQNIPQPAPAIPRGVIVMWSGAINAVPSGWALCNGSNGTPDLRDRMIVGAGASYSSGSTGGATTHSHSLSGTVGYATLSVGQLASHKHGFTQTGGGYPPHCVMFRDPLFQNGSSNDPYDNINGAGGSQSHSHSLSASTYNSNNMPPYYALAYIIKL